MTAVITGLGVISPFGAGVTAFFDGLCSGRSAVAPITSFDAASFPVSVAAEVPAATAERWRAPGAVSDAHARDRKVGFALAAAHQALAQAGLVDAGPGPSTAPSPAHGLQPRAGGHAALAAAALSLGLGLETALLEDFAVLGDHIDWDTERARALAAHAAGERTPRLRTPADLAARALRAHFGLGGPQYLHMSACAAGAAALACAASLIERGRARTVLCGGTDSMINPLGLGGMARLGATSPRAASDACRPFDLHRDGLAMGEGAAMFVVEDAAAARDRGATALAAITGWGSTQDAYKATAPRPDGAAAVAAMQRALQRAGLVPGDLDYLNAHGTGTPLNDVAEAQAIAAVFGPPRLPVSSIKGAIGHAMAAAGALELAACVLALAQQRAPGTTGLRELDPLCAVVALPPGAHPLRLRRVLSNSFGFGGHNASVILEAA